MKIKDRIKDFRRVQSSEILPNPKNWRTHSDTQRNAMRGVLAEVGIAGAVLARETADGLMLIDGHLRVEELEQDVPVLVLDVTEEEADKLLAVFDPIGNLAGKDESLWEQLVESMEFDNEQLAAMITLANASMSDLEQTFETMYQVSIDCDGEQQQQELYEEFAKRGLKCRILSI